MDYFTAYSMGKPKPLIEAAKLRAKLSPQGQLLEPSDPGFLPVLNGATWDTKLNKPRNSLSEERVWTLETRGTESWNKDSLGAPSAICRCANITDVVACVQHAASVQTNHTLCVAGGRHSHLCILDDALVCDLSPMRGVKVDPSNRTVTCDGGCLNGDVNKACAPHGMGFTLGAHPGTGLGGLVLQGGHGALERKTGMSIDSLLSCTVVLADGSCVVASAESNQDLFWALRGGCGNFGVVVSFTFMLHPVGEGGMVMHTARVHLPFTPMVKCLNWPDRAACIRVWANFAQSQEVQADLDINSTCICPAGGPVIHAADVSCPTLSASRAKLEALPIVKFGKPVAKGIKQASYFDDVVWDSFGPFGSNGGAGHYYMGAAMLRDLPEDAVQALAAAASRAPGPGTQSAVIVTMVGGKAGTVPPDATAYENRAARFFVVIMSNWKPDKDVAKRREMCKNWVRKLKENLAPFTLGAYGQVSGNASSFNMRAITDDNSVMYGWNSNVVRLQMAKAKYDPKSLFVNTDRVPESK